MHMGETTQCIYKTSLFVDTTKAITVGCHTVTIGFWLVAPVGDGDSRFPTPRVQSPKPSTVGTNSTNDVRLSSCGSFAMRYLRGLPTNKNDGLVGGYPPKMVGWKLPSCWWGFTKPFLNNMRKSKWVNIFPKYG